MADDKQDKNQYVKLPDGSYASFPSSMGDEDIQAALSKSFPPEKPLLGGRSATMSAAPPPSMLSKMLSKLADVEVPGVGKRLGDVGEDALKLGEMVGTEASMLFPLEGGAETAGAKLLPFLAKQTAMRAPGAVAGYEVGSHYGGKMGYPKLGGAAGAAIGAVSPELVKGAFGKIGEIFGVGAKPAIKAAETATEEDVLKLPVPKGPENKYVGSIPREELKPMAEKGVEGAGRQIQNLGKPIIYTPETGYAPPKMKTTFVEPEAQPRMKFGSRTREELATASSSPEQQAQALRTDNLRLAEAIRRGGPADQLAAAKQRIAQNTQMLQELEK